MKKTMLTLAMFFLLHLSVNAGDNLDAVLKRLETKFQDVNSLTTGFEQQRRLSVFKHELKIYGRIYMKKPSAFAWHVERPFRSAMIIDGDVIKQWDEETNKTQEISLRKNPAFKAAVSQMQLWFSAQYSSLTNGYAIKLVSEDPVVLLFKPKTKDTGSDLFYEIEVSFRDDEKYLRSIAIKEVSGDSMTINFSDTTLNTEIDPKVWNPGK